MALFSKKQKKSIPGSEVNTEDEILGYLDDVIRYRMMLTIRTKKDRFKLALYSIDDKEKLLKIQADPGLDLYADQSVQCGFSLDGTWYIFVSKLVMREHRQYLELPEQILRKERRKSPRARLSPREKVKVTVLQSLGAGVGITGVAVDISLGGICVAIERTMILQQEREVQPSPQLMKKGTQLMVVKVNRIPGVPVFEAPGLVNRIYSDGGWKISIHFPSLPNKIKEQIKRFIHERAPVFSPVYRSRRKRMEMEEARRKDEEETVAETARAAEQEAAADAIVDDTPEPEEIQETGPQLVPPPIDEPAPQEDIFAGGDLIPTLEPTEPTEPAEPIEPTPQEEPIPQEEVVTGKSLVSLGELLDNRLDFLNSESDYTWIHVDNPIRIVKNLNERRPRYLLLPLEFNNQSMLDYLLRIEKMGVLKDVGVILFSEGDVPGRELVKSRMLGIKHILKLPLESHAQLLDILADDENAENAGNVKNVENVGS